MNAHAPDDPPSEMVRADYGWGGPLERGWSRKRAALARLIAATVYTRSARFAT